MTPGLLCREAAVWHPGIRDPRRAPGCAVGGGGDSAPAAPLQRGRPRSCRPPALPRKGCCLASAPRGTGAEGTPKPAFTNPSSPRPPAGCWVLQLGPQAALTLSPSLCLKLCIHKESFKKRGLTEATQMSIGRRRDAEAVGHTHSGVLPAHEKESH